MSSQPPPQPPDSEPLEAEAESGLEDVAEATAHAEADPLPVPALEGTAESPSATTEGEADEGEVSSLEEPPAEPPGSGPREIWVDHSRRRRAPRYARFAVTGAVLFAVVAGVLAYTVGEPASGTDRWTSTLLLWIISIPVGALVGCAVALSFDRKSGR